MENGTFAPQEQMFHFSKYFKSYISKASKGPIVEQRAKMVISRPQRLPLVSNELNQIFMRRIIRSFKCCFLWKCFRTLHHFL